MDQPKDEINRPALTAVLAIGMANFIAFFIISSFLGGDAGNGKMVDGHYFLRNHGTYTEVSGAVFTYSLWHARSLLITHPLAMLAGYILHKTKPAEGGDATSVGFAERCGLMYSRALRSLRDLVRRQP